MTSPAMAVESCAAMVERLGGLAATIEAAAEALDG